jgi:hypothetical protein
MENRADLTINAAAEPQELALRLRQLRGRLLALGHGGIDGFAVTRKIIQGLPEHLSETGRAQIIGLTLADEAAPTAQRHPCGAVRPAYHAQRAKGKGEGSLPELLEGQPGGVMVRVNRTTEHGRL